MATQHHAAVGPEQGLLAPNWLRNGARRRNQAGTGAVNASAVFYGQIRSYAHMEAQSWQPGSRKRRATSLGTMWVHTKETLEVRWEILRKLSAAGHVLQGDAKALVEERELVREALLETEGPVREAAELPQVGSTGWVEVPRAYAAVAGYLRLVNYEFHEETFEQFFSAIQESCAFEMAELWQLRPFTELAIIEQIAEHANEVDGRTPTSVNRPEQKTP